MNIPNKVCNIFGVKKMNKEQEENTFYLWFIINIFTVYYNWNFCDIL